MTKIRKTIIILIASLLVNQANILAQEGILPFLYVESKNGEVVEIAFIGATMTIIDDLIIVNTPDKNHEFDYSDIEKFYFIDKNSLIASKFSDFEINLYPNPTIGKFRLEITNGVKEIKSISRGILICRIKSDIKTTAPFSIPITNKSLSL